jgi:hypothetical protein
MSEWIRAILDLVLIGLVCAGLVQATRLIRHLAGLRQGRIEMERFVYEFNATVIRAEAGIKGLRVAARDSGDDLEKLVEKAYAVRDELQLIVSSADQIAERLSQKATSARVEAKETENKVTENKVAPPKPEIKAAAPQTALAPTPAAKSDTATAPSRAEKELLQALQKLS